MAWVKKKKGWLKDYVKPKDPASVRQRNNGETTAGKENIPYGIIYYPVKCPKCNTKNVKCYSVRPGIRYYRCGDCKWKFKAIEKE